MSPDESNLLRWLGRNESGQYGECHGKALDSLIAQGLAQIHGEETETQNTFIAKGRGIMYRAVSLTDAGWIAFARTPTEEGYPRAFPPAKL